MLPAPSTSSSVVAAAPVVTFTHITFASKLSHLCANDVPYFLQEKIGANVQEIIGTTPACSCETQYQLWREMMRQDSKCTHKALYRIALDFDREEPNEDVVVEAVSAIIKCWAYKQASLSARECVPVKVVYLTRSTRRWHVQILNVSYASRSIECGSIILNDLKESLKKNALQVEGLSDGAKEVLASLDVGAGSHHWLMYGSKKSPDTPDAYVVKFMSLHNPTEGTEIERDTTTLNEMPVLNLRRVLSMHRPYDDEVVGPETCIDYESGDTFECRQSFLSSGKADSEEIQNAINALAFERHLEDVIAATADDDAEEFRRVSEAAEHLTNSASLDLLDDEDGGVDEDSLYVQAANIVSKVAPLDTAVVPSIPVGAATEEEYEVEEMEDDVVLPENIMEYARGSRTRILEVADKIYTESRNSINAAERSRGRPDMPVLHNMDECIAFAREYRKPPDKKSMRHDPERRAITLGIVKLVFEHGYASDYNLWFKRLTPLIVSNMGYSGLNFYRVLCTSACASNIGDDAGIAFKRCVQYLFECSPTHNAKGEKLAVVSPRTVYRLDLEPPFKMTDDEVELSAWIMNTYSNCNFNSTPFFLKYVFNCVERRKCVLIHNKCDDRYDTMKYNPLIGLYQTEPIIGMILPLQCVIFKSILSHITCKDPNTPLDLLFRLHDDLSNIVNHQRPIRIDNNVGEISLYKCELSREYLVFSNGTTYNCELSRFETWNSSQLCRHRIDLDPTMGMNELIEHATVEIHPLRGGREYLYRLLHGFVINATKELNRKYRSAFGSHSSEALNFDIWRSMMAMYPPAEFARITRIVRRKKKEKSASRRSSKKARKKEQQRVSEEDLAYLKHAYQMACKYYMITSFANARPDLYTELMNSMDLCANPEDPNADDDGGPVVIVRRNLTYEQKVWALFDDMFGSREQSMIVMRYLALGLRADNTGRHVLFLHGEAVNGKSIFTEIVQNAMGGRDSKMNKHLSGEYFTNKSSTLDPSFGDDNMDARFLFVPEISILEMGMFGMRKMKRITGGDVVVDRSPYAKKNNEYINVAKLITTSNELPFFVNADTAEISRFVIITMRSFFNPSVVQTRTKHLRMAMMQRATHMTFELNNAFPALFTDYVRECNSVANCMFGEVGIGLGALDAMLPMYPSLTKMYVPPMPKCVPSVRQMLADMNLLDKTVMQKLGAALIRILTGEIIPSMGGITTETVQRCITELDALTHSMHAIISTYKDILLAVIMTKIVRVKDKKSYVNVEELRILVQNDFVNMRARTSTRSNLMQVMFGQFRSKMSGMENDIESKISNLRSFENELHGMGLKCDEYTGEELPYGTPVIYGFLLVSRFNEIVANAISRQTALTALTNDSHIRQYESIFEDMDTSNLPEMDRFMRTKFMKPVVGADPSEYGAEYEDYTGMDMNNSYTNLISEDRFNNVIDNYEDFEEAIAATMPPDSHLKLFEASDGEDDDDSDSDKEEEKEEEEEEEEEPVAVVEPDAEMITELMAEEQAAASTPYARGVSDDESDDQG